MQSKQKIQTTRFSKTKTVTAYFVAGHYLMCSSLAYAGHGFGGNEGDPDSKKTITRPLNNSSNEHLDNNESSSSYLSSFQNAANNTFNWLHESALDGCERFGKWVASYAEDLPPSYFAKSLLEIDYVNDELFWKGHFNQELEDIKEKPYLTFQDQARLKELQDIVWSGLLSPYTYEKALQKLQKQRLFYAVRNIRNAFKSEIKENPEIILQHFRKDLLKSLEGMQNSRIGSEGNLLEKFEKKLIYYRNALNAFDYAETLARFLIGIEEKKGMLALSATQHEDLKESLNDALFKINKAEYLQIREERKAALSPQKNSLQETEEGSQQKETVFAKTGNMGTPDSLSKLLKEDTPSSSYFSYPLSFAKGASTLIQRGVSFSLENPTQAIAMGLAFQAAAVAALSPVFKVTNKLYSSLFGLRISTLSNGNVFVGWEGREFGHDNLNIYGRVMDPYGVPMTNEFLINNGSSNDYMYPSISALNNGNAFVIWNNASELFRSSNIVGCVMDPFGNHATNGFQISTKFDMGTWDSSSVTTLSNGNAFVTWHEGRGDVILGRVMNPFGKPVTNEFRINNWSLSAIRPSIAALSNGNAFVTYFSQYGNIGYGRVMSPLGSPVTNPFNFSIRDGDGLSVAALSNGNAFLTWREFHKTDCGIVGSVMNPFGKPLTNGFCISEEGVVAPPSIASLRNGHAFVTWLERKDTSTRWYLYGRVMDSFGDPVGDKFRIDDGYGPTSPAVAALKDDSTFVVWGDLPNVYGRIIPAKGNQKNRL